MPDDALTRERRERNTDGTRAGVVKKITHLPPPLLRYLVIPAVRDYEFQCV